MSVSYGGKMKITFKNEVKANEAESFNQGIDNGTVDIGKWDVSNLTHSVSNLFSL